MPMRRCVDQNVAAGEKGDELANPLPLIIWGKMRVAIEGQASGYAS
jgi:hypothetical protein